MSALPDDFSPAAPAATVSPFYWSVRREMWENRYLYIAPLAIAALALVAFVVGTLHLPHILQSHTVACKPGPCSPPPSGIPYSIAGIALILTGILVGAFYCLGALYWERRDRSILFWKSLPVSDLVAVLSKASVPFVVVPAIIFVITIAMQLVMLALTGLLVLTHTELIPAFWLNWPFFRMALVLLYGLVTLTLWHAPIYGWLLMVSAWAKRAPFLWALLPPIAFCIAEKIAFNTSMLATLLTDRLLGSFNAAFNELGQTQGAAIQLAQLAPLRFLGTPDLWVGLMIAVAFLATAIRLRRYGGPL